MKRAFEVITRATIEKAYLVGVSLPNLPMERAREHLGELAQLAETAGAEIVGRIVQGRTRLDGATYVGAGMAERLKQECSSLGANLLIFDDDLSPAQARNLEEILGINIIDRTELILDIFARHAKTQQAKIQVELAQLQYALPRLTRLWKHLSRQAGGIGLRGPGETQLEVDRRRIHQRMGALRRQLKKIDTHRETLRQSHNGLPLVVLVGYTNAGKSTLMNSMTGADVVVKDQLFATLDTTTRRLEIPNHGGVLLVDTVGFIRKLPDHLVTSFRATLEDTARANLFLHVVNAAHPAFEEQLKVTDATLRSIGSEAATIHIFNKVDEISLKEIDGMKARFPNAVFTSALHGTGIDALLGRIEESLFGDDFEVEVKIPAWNGRGISQVRGLLHDTRRTYEGDICVFRGTIEGKMMQILESVVGAEVRFII